jgi:hypothetical protein
VLLAELLLVKKTQRKEIIMKKTQPIFKWRMSWVLALFAVMFITSASAQTLTHSYDFETDLSDGTGSANATAFGTASVSGGSLVLDADGDYISFDGTALGISAYSAVTLEFVYQSNNGFNGWNWSYYFGDDGGANSVRGGFFTWSQTAFVGGGVESWTTTSEDGVWHHIVQVVSGTTMSIYKDGALINEVATSGLTIGSLQNYLGKGSDAWGDPTWQGLVDEFNIYDGVMDAATVSSRAASFVNVKAECFNQEYPSKTNLIDDPTFSDINNFGGWNTHEINYNSNYVYCGPTSGHAGDNCGGSLDAILTGKIAPNTSYRVKAKVYANTGAFHIGFWGMDISPNEFPSSLNGQWEEMDFIITSGPSANNGDAGLYFNSCGRGGTGGYIDNLEMYEVDNDATLASLTSSEGTLNPVFSSGTTTYSVQLAPTVQSVTITAIANSANSSVSGDGVIALTDGVGSASIDVTAESGTVQTYTVNFSAASIDANLSDLQVAGATITGFDANTTTYYYALADGAVSVPTVTGTENDVNATSVVVTDATSVGGTTTVTVTAEDGVTDKTYSINFITKLHSYDFEGDATDGVGSLDGTINGNVAIANGMATVDPAADGAGQNYGYISLDGTALGLASYENITLEAMIQAGNGTNDSWTMLYYFGDNASNYLFSQMTQGADR